MFGLDQAIAGLAGEGPAVVLAVALLLGLRHATDPDHLVAVSTLVASEEERPARRATTLGLGWGLGHATTLVGLGFPVVLFGSALPGWTQGAAELLVGLVIVLLGARLLVHWRRGRFHAHPHSHQGGVVHRHLHGHGSSREHEHEHPALRSPLQTYTIGCLHGVGGSAAVGVLLLASIVSRPEAIAALLLSPWRPPCRWRCSRPGSATRSRPVHRTSLRAARAHARGGEPGLRALVRGRRGAGGMSGAHGLREAVTFLTALPPASRIRARLFEGGKIRGVKIG